MGFVLLIFGVGILLLFVSCLICVIYDKVSQKKKIYAKFEKETSDWTEVLRKYSVFARYEAGNDIAIANEHHNQYLKDVYEAKRDFLDKLDELYEEALYPATCNGKKITYNKCLLVDRHKSLALQKTYNKFLSSRFVITKPTEDELVKSYCNKLGIESES